MKKITTLEEKEVVSLYQQRLSAGLISEKLGLSLTQIYDALKRNKIMRRHMSLCNEIRFQDSPLSFSFRDDLSVEENQLLIAAIMLYVGEGAKTGKTVDLANSNPDVLKVFIKFLREICQVQESKLRFYLYCFSDQESEKLVEYWSQTLHVDKNLFTKPYIRQAATEKTRIMPYGLLHIRYNDKRLLEKILFLCSTVMAQLIDMGRYQSGQLGQTVKRQPLGETLE